jgi:hypothetical protein
VAGILNVDGEPLGLLLLEQTLAKWGMFRAR